MKKIRFFIVLLTISSTLSLNAQTLKIVVRDCSNDNLLSDVTIRNSVGTIIGLTDKNGGAEIQKPNSYPIILQKEGYETGTIYDSLHLKSVCLFPLSFGLKEVIIKAQKFNVGDYLYQLYLDNRKEFNYNDSVSYFKYTCSLSFPDSSWKEETVGYIARTRQGAITFKNVGDGLYFVQYAYSNTDDAFTKTKPYKKAHIISPFSLLSLDMIGNHQAIDSSLWKFITNPPWRHLLLRKNNGEKEFDTFAPSNKESVMEKFHFDSTAQLQSIELFTPSIANNGMDYAGSTTYNYAAQNDEHSYVHTIYTYTTNAPKQLSSITHSSFYSDKKTTYEVQMKIEAVNFVPETKCYIPLIYGAKGDLRLLRK